MAGRTLGEAWVTIRPETAGFREELQGKVRAAMKGFKPNLNVTVSINAETAKLRTKLQAAVTAASAGLDAKTDVNVGVNKASLAKARAEIDAASQKSASSYAKWWEKALHDKAANETAAAQKAASSYVSWWDKALNQRVLSERAATQKASEAERAATQKASEAEQAATQKATSSYVAWWDKALNQRVLSERAAVKKASDAEQAATQKATASYVSWWSKALDQQELNSRKVTDDMRKNIAGLDGMIEDYKRRLSGMVITTDDDQSKSQINVLQTRAEVLRTTLGSISTNVGVARAMAQLAVLDAAAIKFRHDLAGKSAAPPGLELTLAQSQLVHLANQAKSLKKDITTALSPSGITIGTVSHDVMKDLTSLKGGVEVISAELEHLRAKGGVSNSDDIAKVKTLTSSMGQLSSAVAADGVTVKNATKSWRGWVNALIDIARVQIPLFNGAFDKMLPHFLAFASGTHILVEAALEIVAVWVPAAMALTVFAAAAAKASFEVYHDVRNMGIAANGTGQQFEGMSKRIGKSMSDIAKPYVFEAYGLGLIALQKQSTTTASVIKTMGGTIDKWISEAVIAYQKGTGQMALKGASDFGILGDSFKQVGTIINGFIKMTPGYAHDLLVLGDSILHVASSILNSGFAQKFGSIFLAAHGAFFYLGLFATLASKLGMTLLMPIARITGLSKVLGILGVTADGTKGKLGTLMSSVVAGWQTGTGKLATAADKTGKEIEKGLAVAFTSSGPITAANKMSSELKTAMTTGVESSVTGAGREFSNFKSVASSAMSGLGSKVVTSAKGIKGALSGMLAGLGINPWLLGVAAIGAAVFALVRMFSASTTAAEAFGAAAKQALSSASLSDFSNTVAVQTKTAQSSLNSAKSAFAKYADSVHAAKGSNENYTKSLTRMNTIVPGTTAGLANMQNKVQGWQAALDGINAQNHTFNSNLNMIAKTAGVDLPTAMNLASQAGITTKQMMSDQGVAAQEDALQVAGLVRGYASLVNGVGGVNTAYQAMNIQSSQIMKNAQSVSGAFANYTTLITGGAGAFDTFVQGQATLSTNLQATGKNAGAATLSLGKLRDKITVAGASLDGLSPAAVTANQAFLQQVNNSQALYGSLLQLAAASGNTRVAQNNLGIAGKDMVSTLLRTAGGSKAAQQQIYSLAQTFGYAGKDTLPALVKWLGFTGDRTTDLQKRMNGLTAGAGNLQQASKALSGELNSQLSGALSKSIIDAEGGQAAFDKLAGAVRKFAAKSSANNMSAIIKQGQSLKQVFVSSAGSAAAAEPVLTNYFMTLGIKNQTLAKKMADKILGIGSAASHIQKPLAANQAMFEGWAKDVHASTGAAGDLWAKLSKNNFNPLSGDVDHNRKRFMVWADQVHISKGKAGELWQQLLDNKLQTVNAQVDGNKNKFIDLMVKMGETKSAAADLWKELLKAPKVNPQVNMYASTSGQIAAVASAPGAAKQTIGRLFFSAQGRKGMATGGKIPGWHNTGDNLMASSPGGPIALQGGEAIVPKYLATHPEFTSFAKKRGIPGFSGGGLVGTDKLVNMTDNFPQYKADVGSALATHAVDAMKANTDAAYNAIVNAFGGTGGSATSRSILMDAEKYKGHRYVWGGPSNPQSGWDCSSFAGYVLGHDMHMKLPGGAAWNGAQHGPTADAYNNMPGYHLASHNVNQIQAGDLLVENSGGHVGFGVGPNRMFSAYGKAVGTIFSDASRMTNIYRRGGSGGGGMPRGLVTKSPFINTMSTDIERVYDQSAAIKSMFAQLNGTYSGNPSTPPGGATGSNPANGRELYNYLLTNLFGGNKIAAAGATASIWGESGWNPFAQGTGGRGLIGWTPPSTLSNAAFSGGMATQLPAIIDFVRRNGDMGAIASMMHAGSVEAAAQIWDHQVERAGISDVHSGGIATASGFMSTGGMVPGFARGGKVTPQAKDLARLEKLHNRYAADYHRHLAQAGHDKSPAAKKYQREQAAMYAQKISAVDTAMAYDRSAKLKMPKPSNSVVRLAERLASPPWVNTLTSGKGSVTPLGWAMQPALGDLMIAKAMGTSQWMGKAAIDPQASSVMANWAAAMGSIGGFLNSAAGASAIQLAGKATGIHGRQTEGPKKSFLGGGTIRENVLGIGHSGDLYKFHSGDKITGPAIAATQAANGGLSQEDRMILLGLLNEAKKSNQIAANQGHSLAKAINQNASRAVNRP